MPPTGTAEVMAKVSPARSYPELFRIKGSLPLCETECVLSV
jgi:hypothetical protein